MPEIRKASGVAEGALRRFYVDVFPARATFLAEHWRWLYRVGRFPGIEPLVLVEKDRVVGHAGAIPVKISRLGREATAIWFVDFAVLPELQGRGHGLALTKAWMAMCPDRVTFCNERSIKVFRKLGWKERYDASVLTQPFELSDHMKKRFGPFGSVVGRASNRIWLARQRARLSDAPALKVEPLPHDANLLAKLLDDPAASVIRVVRDPEWFQWRLLENPRLGDLILARAGGVSAVFRLLRSLGRRRAHLLYVGHGPAAARAGMIRAFARWALEQDADDAWVATNDPVLLAASAPCFTRRHPLRFAWHSDDAKVFGALSGPLSTQGIDSDHDLMFP